jgi:hypothetical protein
MRFNIFILFLIILTSCEKRGSDKDIFLKFFGDAREDLGYSISSTEGGYVITGQLTELLRKPDDYIIEEKSVKKLGIIKCGTDGNLIWKATFPPGMTGVGHKVISLNNGVIVATGCVTDTVSLQKNIIVVRIKADGTGALSRIYKYPGNQTGYDIIETPEGYLVLGTTDVERLPVTQSTGNIAGKKDVLLIRLNKELEAVAMPVALGFPGNDVGTVIKNDIDGGYIIAGTTDRSEPGQAGQAGSNIFLLRINTDGNTTQPAIIGGPDDEFVADIEVLSDGYIIAGTTGEEGSVQKIFVSRISKNIYETPYINKLDIKLSSSSISSFSVKAMNKYHKNYFVMAGQAGSGSSVRQLILITDEYGNIMEDRVRILGSSGIQIAYDVLTESNGDIIAVGKNAFEKNTMISLFKFNF